MAVCNLFKAFTKETGNFLTFSQYVEDLTKSTTEGINYKVVPSKFIVLDVDYSKFEDGLKSDTIDYNSSVPKYLQNNFENACAFLKNKLNKEEHGIEWNPEISSHLFWRYMIESHIINMIEYDNTHYIDNVRWIGDINIQSYDEKDGMGYSELFCYIPNDAKNTRFDAEKLISDDMDSYIINNSSIVEGCDLKDFLYTGMLLGSLNPPTFYFYKKKYDFAFLNDDYNKSESDDNNFNINTIVILYDIISTDSENNNIKLYENIPMGFYITGLINNDGTVTNTIKKYVKNEDIYNEGTSYGLRICSRFTVNPNNININNIDITTNDNVYSEFCQTMSKMGDVLLKLEDVIESIYNKSQTDKELLAIFKNSRTNVPYMKNINGKNYWFVNGKNMGIEGTSVLDNSNPKLVSMDDSEVIQTLTDILDE